MLPWFVVFVVGVNAAQAAATNKRVPWGLILVLAGTVVALAVVVHRLRGKLAEGQRGEAAEEDRPDSAD